jgi:serine/threonine protein kinase
MQTWHGMSDSLAGVTESPAECEQCRAATRLGNGLCLSCILREGLEADREASSEIFENVLLEAKVTDKEWRLGNYEILEEIGRGGMGVIYRARQRHSRRIVAVKCVLNYHADSRETLERFRREAEAAASLDHPNILPIYEVSQDVDGLPFFSMKFAPGGSLAAAAPALRTAPRVSIALIAKVARAVQFAHEQGILHRDLKPGNVMLDGRGEPLVSDFGLAKWLDTNTDLTRTLTIFGTPGYIAPEQAQGPAANLTPAADVYSLGAILFDLLAGRPPFLGSHALSVIRQAAEKPAPKLRTLSKLADRDLETICARCLERDPNARYRSAGDLADDLERWVEGRPIIARPLAVPTRLWRWSRRNRKLVVTAFVCVAVAAALFAVRPTKNVTWSRINDFFGQEMEKNVARDAGLAFLHKAQFTDAATTRIHSDNGTPYVNGSDCVLIYDSLASDGTYMIRTTDHTAGCNSSLIQRYFAVDFGPGAPAFDLDQDGVASQQEKVYGRFLINVSLHGADHTPMSTAQIIVAKVTADGAVSHDTAWRITYRSAPHIEVRQDGSTELYLASGAESTADIYIGDENTPAGTVPIGAVSLPFHLRATK